MASHILGVKDHVAEFCSVFSDEAFRAPVHRLFVEHLEGRCCCYFVRIMGNAPADEVVLYNSSLSPFGQRVTIALKEKRISYEVSPVDLFNKTEEFLALNPVHKQVPVLVHQGHPVLESAIILEYIDEAWPSEPLLIPRDPVQRSVARFWVDFINRVSAPGYLLLFF